MTTERADDAGYLFVTFKVTADGEAGHPMDHVLTRINLDAGGEPTPESLKLLDGRIRRELKRKYRRD